MTRRGWTRAAALLALALVLPRAPAAVFAPAPLAAPVSATSVAGAATAAVVHYDARVDVDVEHGRVSGTVTMTAVAGQAGAGELGLDSGDLVVDAARVAGRPAVFNRADRRLTIALPRGVAPGKQIEVSIGFHGQPRVGVRFFADRRQAYTVFSTSQWMVCDDAPDRKATLKLTVTTPDPELTVIGSGRRAADGAWVLDTPTSTYLFAFAVGRFHHVTATHRGVKLIYQSESFSDDELRAIFHETPAMLDFFEARSGVSYRGAGYTQVLAAGSAEQEAGQLTLLNEGSGRALLKDPSDVWLEAHELAHQWWGNGVTCRAWTDFWLNEGFATFMADAYKERRFGREAYLREIEASHARYERVRDEGHDHALVYADWTHPTAADRTIVYHKGAYVLHLLREELGDDVFWRALRAYTRAFMGKSVATADFQQAMERASGVDLTAFFRRWVYSTGGGVGTVVARLRMPLYTTDALILRTYKLGESDRIVVFLTRDRGKKRGVAKNARQSRRRFGGGARTADVRARRLLREGAARSGAAELRRAAAIAAVGGRRRGARLRRLFRRADRRVGAGSGSERALFRLGASMVEAIGAGRADRAAGAVLRVLAAAAAGRVSGPDARLSDEARGVSRRRARR